MDKKVESFEDLRVWQEAQVLAKAIYKTFKSCTDWSFKDQICRAAVSVSNNIAEGFERKGNKELRRYLFIAKGSSGEVRSMLYLADELSYVTEQTQKKLIKQSVKISKMLSVFINKLPND